MRSSYLFGGLALMMSVAMSATEAGRGSGAAQKSQTDHKHAYLYVEEAGRRARSNESSAVRAFTDEIINRSLLAQAAPSIRERVAKNDLAFRLDLMPGITEDRLIETVNQRVQTLGFPTYMRLSKGQLKLVRRDLRTFVRHFANSDPARGTPPIDMSPAEVVFVTADLLLQKLYNQEYQVAPERWEAVTLEKRKQAASQKHAPQAPPSTRSFAVVKPASDYLRLRQALSDEASSVVLGVHLFLDALGFGR